MKKRFLWVCASLAAWTGMNISSFNFVKAAEQEITKAQPPLEKQNLTIKTKTGKQQFFSIEIAKTPKEQEIGEMFRTEIPDDGGMLFIWPYPQSSSMWMKNTVVPLDIVFIDTNNHIQYIAENTVPYSLAPINSLGTVKATLELKGGITEKLGIMVGDTVESLALQIPNGKQIIKNESKK